MIIFRLQSRLLKYLKNHRERLK